MIERHSPRKLNTKLGQRAHARANGFSRTICICIARVGVKFVLEISRLTVLLKIDTIASLLFI